MSEVRKLIAIPEQGQSRQGFPSVPPVIPPECRLSKPIHNRGAASG
jgi:hypothetical protein